MKESDIQKQIMDYLEARQYLHIRINSGLILKGNRAIRLAPEGTSDIIAMHPNTGKFIAIEIKKPGEKLSDEQLDFLSKVKKGCGIPIIADCIEDVIDGLK